MARPAASRTARSWSDSLFSASVTVSASSPTVIAHAGHRLVEQAVPGGMAGDLLLVQQLFQIVGQLVRAENAQVAQPGPPSGQRRVGQLRLQHRIVQPVQLQREEQQVGADGGRAFIDRLVEAADRRIGGIAGEQQAGRRTAGGRGLPRFARTLRWRRPASRPAARPACRHRRRQRPARACRQRRNRPPPAGHRARDTGRTGPRPAARPRLMRRHGVSGMAGPRMAAF